MRLNKQKTRNRLFYIIIPYTDFSQTKSFGDSLKEFLAMLVGKELVLGGKRKEAYEKSLRILAARTEDITEKIEKTGIEAKRLKSNQLLSLYTTYFSDMFEINSSYLSPVMWLKSRKQNTEYKKFVDEKMKEKLHEIHASTGTISKHLKDLNHDDRDRFYEIYNQFNEGESQ